MANKKNIKDKKDIGIIDDKYYVEYEEKIKKHLREHEEENIRRAEEKEERLLNKPTPMLDAIIDGIEKVRKLITRKQKSKTIEQTKQSGNSR